MIQEIFFGLLAVGVLVFSVWTFVGLRHEENRRKAICLAGLRACSALVLALVLIQPQCTRRIRVAERPIIGVLIDTSQSMNDGPAGRNRASVAREWLESAAFRKARETCDLRFFSVSQTLTEGAAGKIAFDGSESHIARGLTEWVRRWGGEQAAGVVLISDGLDSEGQVPGNLEIPCWVMEVELPTSEAAERVAVWQVEPPRRAIVGAESQVRVVLQGWGVEGRNIPVELWSDGRKVTEKPAFFSTNGSVVEVMLPIKPERVGDTAYELRVADAAADAAAKSQKVVVDVKSHGQRVLMLSNTLGFEGKFLRRALTTDRNVQLDSYARWQDGRWASLGDGGPAAANMALDLSPAGLAVRDAIVIADVSPDALGTEQWQAIVDYVDKGGGLVVLGGPHLLASPLAGAVLGRVLPVPTPAPHGDGRFGVKLTDSGLRHPVFGPLFEAVKRFPTLQGINSASGVAGNAQVLMESIAEGQASPLVVVKQQGAGRVAVVLSDTLWRWRVAAPGWTGRLSAYDTFWGQMLDWLMAQEKSPSVSTPNASPIPKAGSDSPAAAAERRGEVPDVDFLRAIAQQSGGEYYASGEGNLWLKSLPKSNRENELETVTDVWNHPFWVVLLLGSLSAEWWLRRRSGLV